MPKDLHRVLLAAIVIGCALRLVWPADMEWKTDERILTASAIQAAKEGAIPAAGMKSGGGILNPGLSVGVFALVARFSHDPLVMVSMVQWANVIALLGFLLLASLRFRGQELMDWSWGLAIAAVNPLAILFSRKIWAQDLLPLMVLLILVGHLSRRKGWGAFLWGLAGSLIGQVHMSGFFLAMGLLLVTVAHDRANGVPFRWALWLAGSTLGGLLLLPWLEVIVRSPSASNASFWNIFQLNFFFYWIIDALGVDGPYSLRDEFLTFLREPLVAGTPTFLVGIAHVVLMGTGVLVVKGIVRLVRRQVVRVRALSGWRAFFVGMPATDLYFWAILLGLGFGMPMAGVTIYQHYLICSFPFAFIFLVRMLHARTRPLLVALVAQLFISGCFLWYIHRNGGAPEGDYGKTYRNTVLSNASDLER